MDEPSAGSGPLLASVVAYARCRCCCTLSKDPDWCFFVCVRGGVADIWGFDFCKAA